MKNKLITHFISVENNYLLVMEYADSGTLQDYLKKNFKNLTWSDKYNLAYQLTHAVLCLHNGGIVHRDLVHYFYYISSCLFKL
jgi:serine/threonine protein kinase